MPHHLGGVRRCYVSFGSGLQLIFQEGSRTVTCPEASDPPHHPRGARRCHASFGTEPCLTVKEGSDTDTRPLASDRVSPQTGGLRCLHVSHGSPQAVGCRDKERLSCNDMQQGSHISKTRPHDTEVPARCVGRRRYHDMQTLRTCATAPCYSAPPAQLIAHGHGGQRLRHDRTGLR
jgi:hypothetical protein